MGRFNKSNLIRGMSYLKRNGVKEAFYKAAERISRDKDEILLDDMVFDEGKNQALLENQRKATFEKEYKISILVPAYETDETLFVKMLESVANQTYSNFELCIADASGTDERRQIVRRFCEEHNLDLSDRFGSIYDKIKYKHLDENLGISGNTNAALSMATGEYIALLDHDDMLDVRALYEFMWEVSRRNDVKILFAYTDEDKINEDGSRHFDFHIKPDFDPVMICTNNYICHLTFVDTFHARSVGGFRSQYDGAQDHDFILRCIENIKKEQILHIQKVLYHWRSTAASTAENPNAKLYAYDAGKRAVQDHLTRLGIKAKVTDTSHLGYFKIEYEKSNAPVVVFTKEEFDELSDKSILEMPQEFILIVSSKLRAVTKDYEARMLSCMNNNEIGAVTGKIIAKNGRIESAGYDRIQNGMLKPRFADLNSHFSGYMHRASTALSVDGFSEELVLIRKQAALKFRDGIVLKDNYYIYYEPAVVFKRRHI